MKTEVGVSRWPALFSISFLLALLSLSAPLGHGSSGGATAAKVIGQTDFVSSLHPSNSVRIPAYDAFDGSGMLWVTDQQNNRILEYKPPFTIGMSPSLAIGQPDLVTYFAKTTQDGLSLPAGLGFDSSGNLWVADSNNHRVLQFVAPFSTGMNASIVIGQTSFIANLHGTTQGNLYFPNNVVVGPSGNLWVTDQGNSRLVEFKPPFSDGMQASLVLGQANFASGSGTSTQNGLNEPASATFDSSGNVWVADFLNSRVVEFATPLASGMAASLVLGHTNFTSNTYSTTQITLDGPTGLTFDSSNNLWVSDTYNSRVVEFKGPFSNGESATLVLGHLDFASFNPENNQGGFYRPGGIAFDGSGDLWVADSLNNRILQVKHPFSSGELASIVVGEFDYTADLVGGANSLRAPVGEAFDLSGNLWIADQQNNRIVEFMSPLSTGMDASVVLGEKDFRTNYGSTDQDRLSLPRAVAFDKSGNLWVADAYNSRVLEFSPPFSSGMPASLVIGQSDFVSNSAGAGANGLSIPSDITLDSSGNLWVSDLGNNRVLEFKPPFSSGMSPSLVLGQTGFTSNSAGTTPSQLYYPTNLRFDSSQNLWISDSYNNRVLEFKAPFSNGMSASVALGQSSFTSSLSDLSRRGLYFPNGLSFDASGNLWVSDTFNNRVLEFQSPYTTGMNASMVIGQPDYTTRALSTSEKSLRGPGGVAFDPGGNLWISDRFNNRALEFQLSNSTGSTTTTTTTTTSSLSTTSTTSSTSSISTLTTTSTISSTTTSSSTTTTSSATSGSTSTATSSSTTTTSTTTAPSTTSTTSTATTVTTSTASATSTSSATSTVPEFPAASLAIIALVSVAIVAAVTRRFSLRRLDQ